MQGSEKLTAQFELYNETWCFNLQKLEEIQNDLTRSFRQLEIKYQGFDSIYTKVEEALDVLSSLYAGFNTVEGREYILKLRALVSAYKKRYTTSGINFTLIDFLSARIRELRDRSFSDFPVLKHGPATDERDRVPGKIIDGRPFRYVTFMRRGSWFIAGFSDIAVHGPGQFEVVSAPDGHSLTVRTGEHTVTAADYFSAYSKEQKDPSCIISINGRTKHYAADIIGKKVFSRHDIITPLVTPFTKNISARTFLGRVKIFGKNHLMIRQAPFKNTKGQ